VIEYSPPTIKGLGSDKAIQIITDVSSEFPQEQKRIIARPSAIVTTSNLDSGTINYEEGSARFGLLDTIISPLQIFIPQFPEDVMQINLNLQFSSGISVAQGGEKQRGH